MSYVCDGCLKEWLYESNEEYVVVEKRIAGTRIPGSPTVTVCMRCFVNLVLHFPFGDPELKALAMKVLEGG